nr:DUF397 domain-containing protein [Streptomyces sp. V1I6]
MSGARADASGATERGGYVNHVTTLRWPTTLGYVTNRTPRGVTGRRCPKTQWRKSSYSGNTGGDCVEVAGGCPTVAVPVEPGRPGRGRRRGRLAGVRRRPAPRCRSGRLP